MIDRQAVQVSIYMYHAVTNEAALSNPETQREKKPRYFVVRSVCFVRLCVGERHAVQNKRKEEKKKQMQMSSNGSLES